MRTSILICILTSWFCAAAEGALLTYSDETLFINDLGPQSHVDFGEVGTGTVLSDQIPGLDFSSFNGGTPTTAETVGILPPKTPPNQMKTVAGTMGGGGFQIDFISPAIAVGISLGDYQGGDQYGRTYFELLDATGQVLDKIDITDLVTPGPGEWRFFGVASTEPFSTLQVTIGASDFVTFDDLRYATIPAPSSLASAGIVALIVAGVGCDRRKLRTRAV
jgi:hypothetical protein